MVLKLSEKINELSKNYKSNKDQETLGSIIMDLSELYDSSTPELYDYNSLVGDYGGDNDDDDL